MSAHWATFDCYGTLIDFSGADPARHVHVAASLFHDITSAAALGLEPCGSIASASGRHCRERESSPTCQVCRQRSRGCARPKGKTPGHFSYCFGGSRR